MNIDDCLNVATDLRDHPDHEKDYIMIDSSIVSKEEAIELINQAYTNKPWLDIYLRQKGYSEQVCKLIKQSIYDFTCQFVLKADEQATYDQYNCEKLLSPNSLGGIAKMLGVK